MVSHTSPENAAYAIIDLFAPLAVPDVLISNGLTKFRNDSRGLDFERPPYSRHFPATRYPVDKWGEWGKSCLPFLDRSFTNCAWKSRNGLFSYRYYKEFWTRHRHRSEGVQQLLRHSWEWIPLGLLRRSFGPLMQERPRWMTYIPNDHHALQRYKNSSRSGILSVREQFERIETSWVILYLKEIYQIFFRVTRFGCPRRLKSQTKSVVSFMRPTSHLHTDLWIRLVDRRIPKWSSAIAHGTCLKSYRDDKLDAEAIIPHFISSEAGILASRWVGLIDYLDILKVLVRWKGLSSNEVSLEQINIVYQCVQKISFRLLNQKNNPSDLAAKVRSEPGL